MMLGFILIALVTFTLDTIQDKPEWAIDALFAVEAFTVIVFSIEYALRLYVAERRVRFVFSFFGIVDFLAIAPFYVGLGVDLRSLRILRLFRLFRVFKLLRYRRTIPKRFFRR